MSRINLKHIIIVLSLIPGTSALALQSDRNQAINIKADRVEVNEKTQISHYSGNVQLEQGTLKISAETVIVHLQDGRLDKIIIDGKPASFEQQPDAGKETVKSRADHMEYFAAKETLILQHDAHVIQGANHFSGDYIEYNTLNSTVKATKGKDSDTRVHAVILPGNSDEKANENPPPKQPKVKPESDSPAAPANSR